MPFVDQDVEIRTVICSTDAIESLNARYRRSVTVRGHFPTGQAALKCLYLVTRSLDPEGVGHQRWAMRWKPALNTSAVIFGDCAPKAENYSNENRRSHRFSDRRGEVTGGPGARRTR